MHQFFNEPVLAHELVSRSDQRGNHNFYGAFPLVYHQYNPAVSVQGSDSNPKHDKKVHHGMDIQMDPLLLIGMDSH